jgi:hypothetical protein
LGALALVVAGWCALGIGVRATYGAQLTADEPQYVLSAISLAEDLDLDISDELTAERWRDFHAPAALPVQTKVLDGGRQVSPHDPLLPVVLAIPVALGGWVGAKVALAALAGALAALLAWIAHRRLGVPFWLAVAGTAVFGLSPPLAVYGTQVYPELPAALVVAGAVAVLTAPRFGGRQTAGLVVLVVALPWLSVKYATVTATLALVGGRRLWREGRVDLLWRAVAVLVAAAAVFAVVHQVVYGGWTPYAAGDHFVGGEATVMGVDVNVPGRARRLVGLLVDRDFGLVPWQPAFLLLVPAVAHLAFGQLPRPRRPQLAETAVKGAAAAALLLPLAAGWFTATFLALTMHGYWWPGRQVVVVLPCAVLAVLAFAAPSRARAVAVLGLGAAGIVSFVWLVADDVTWVVDFMTTSDPLYRMWRPLLPDGRSTAAGDLVRTAAWSALALVAVVYGGLAARTKTVRLP